MKACIVSLFGTFNYGNRLQSYAVQEVIRGFGLQTEAIYVQPLKTTVRELAKKAYFSPYITKIINPSTESINKYQRQKNFEEFNNRYITTKKYSSIKSIGEYDYYILGSDQVWNPKRYDSIKKELFFLSFTESDNKVCFSPSFGVSDIPEEWKQHFADRLKNFRALSVREEAGARIIKSLTGKDVEVLIDPTLMINAEKWRTIEDKPSEVGVDSNYILDYFIGGVTEKAKETEKRLSIERNLRIHDLFDMRNRGLYTAGPSQFLYLIDHATLIQTDSFHACIFAFLFGKPFLLYAREGTDTDMLSRIETLFNTFDLMRKYVDSGYKNDLFECDYSTGYKALHLEREKAYNFLKKEIEI